jgi:hypothetical protein
MVGLPCLVSQCAKLNVAGWTWEVFTRVSDEVYDFYSVSPEGHKHTFRTCNIYCCSTAAVVARTLSVLSGYSFFSFSTYIELLTISSLSAFKPVYLQYFLSLRLVAAFA